MCPGSLPGVGVSPHLRYLLQHQRVLFSCFSFQLIGLHKLNMAITSGEVIVASQQGQQSFPRNGWQCAEAALIYSVISHTLLSVT